MNLTEIAPIDAWKTLEEEIYQRSGLNASVFDNQGKRITDSVHWVNEICPKIKSNPKGQTFICSLAHQNVVNRIEKSAAAVIDECDAGLIKFAVPIYHQGTLLGVAGGCGLLPAHGEVDTFLVHQTIETDEETLIDLSRGIDQIDQDRLNQTIAFVESEIESMLKAP